MNNKLTKRVMFGYGAAALSFNFVWGMVSTYVNIYFINVLGISIFAAGLIVLIARVWDGFNDPIMGSIVDNTKTKMGKYRPFLLWGMLPLVLSTILIFQNPSLSDELKTVYAGVVYILFGMSYTFANIPYMAMISTMTKDPDERTMLVTIKNIFVMVGGMLPMMIITSIAISDEGYNQGGFTIAAIIASILLIITMFITFRSTKNHKYLGDTKTEKITWKTRVNAVFKNKPLKILMIVMFVFSIQTVLMGAQTFYVVDALDQGGMAFTFSLVMLPGMFIAMGSMVFLKKKEKHHVVIIGMVIQFIGSLLFQFAPTNTMTILLVASFIKAIGFGYIGIMLFSMIADCVDYALYLTGEQQGGIIFSATTFVQKAVAGVGAMLLSSVLIMINFVPDAVGQQPAEAIAGLKFLNGGFPAIMAIVVILVISRYPLTKDKLAEYNNTQ